MRLTFKLLLLLHFIIALRTWLLDCCAKLPIGYVFIKREQILLIVGRLFLLLGQDLGWHMLLRQMLHLNLIQIRRYSISFLKVFISLLSHLQLLLLHDFGSI